MTDADRLELAVLRLIQFRASWNAEDLIDEDSALSAADLDRIIARLKETWDVVMIEQIDLRDLDAVERMRGKQADPGR